ncbi:hypothetical protein VP01_293g1, partial [Puccinia sorghi]
NYYVYLGIPLGHTLGIGYEEESALASLTAKKVRMRVGQFSCLLKDKNTPLYVKTSIIKTYILSTALYGGEWIGMNKSRTDQIQKETWSKMNQAAASWELSIPLISVACAQARHRILAKSGELLTDAKPIFAGKEQGSKKKTWSSITRAKIGKALAKVARGTVYRDKKYSKKIAKTWIDNNGASDSVDAIKQERTAVVATLWHAAMDDGTLGDEGGYSRRQMGNSRDFIKTALYYPELREEIRVLVKFRLNIYPTYEELYKATSAGRSICGIKNCVREAVGRSGCPLCKNKDIKYSNRNHVHLLLHCTHLKELRDKHLTPLIKRMHSDFNKGGLSDLAMADLLLGAYCCVSGPEKPERRQEARKGSPIWWTIRRFQLGWGQLTGRMPENICEYGFVPVAKFLYTALKLYFRECEEALETLVVL